MFTAVVLGTCVVHLATLTRSPPAWQDEVQIIDYGRVMLPGSDESFGISWNAGDRPIRPLNFVGPLLQELACRGSANTSLGPRLSVLIGAAVAASAMRGWLLAGGVSPWIAFIAAWAFLWDPLFASSYRSARVDSWCMAALLTSLWCVRLGSRNAADDRILVAAGAFVAVAALIWPSAILLAPLLAYEIYDSSRNASDERPPGPDWGLWRRFSQRALVVTVSATVFMMLLLLPFVSSLGDMIGGLNSGIALARGARYDRSLGAVSRLAGNFFNCPLLPLFAIGGAILLRRRVWLIPFSVALGLAVSSNPYAYRAVYLVPYFTYGSALAADAWARTRAPYVAPRRLLVWLSALLLLWSGGISICVRTAIATLEWRQRDPAAALRLVDKLGAGVGTRVLLDSWSLYYALRARGWSYWGPLDRRTDEQIAESLDYDYVIHDEAAGVRWMAYCGRWDIDGMSCTSSPASRLSARSHRWPPASTDPMSFMPGRICPLPGAVVADDRAACRFLMRDPQAKDALSQMTRSLNGRWRPAVMSDLAAPGARSRKLAEASAFICRPGRHPPQSSSTAGCSIAVGSAWSRGAGFPSTPSISRSHESSVNPRPT